MSEKEEVVTASTTALKNSCEEIIQNFEMALAGQVQEIEADKLMTKMFIRLNERLRRLEK